MAKNFACTVAKPVNSGFQISMVILKYKKNTALLREMNHGTSATVTEGSQPLSRQVWPLYKIFITCMKAVNNDICYLPYEVHEVAGIFFHICINI